MSIDIVMLLARGRRRAGTDAQAEVAASRANAGLSPDAGPDGASTRRAGSSTA